RRRVTSHRSHSSLRTGRTSWPARPTCRRAAGQADGEWGPPLVAARVGGPRSSVAFAEDRVLGLAGRSPAAVSGDADREQLALGGAAAGAGHCHSQAEAALVVPRGDV